MRVTLEDKHLLFKAQKLKVMLLRRNCSYLQQNYLLAWVPHVGVSHMLILVNAYNNPNLEHNLMFT